MQAAVPAVELDLLEFDLLPSEGHEQLGQQGETGRMVNDAGKAALSVSGCRTVHTGTGERLVTHSGSAGPPFRSIVLHQLGNSRRRAARGDNSSPSPRRIPHRSRSAPGDSPHGHKKPHDTPLLDALETGPWPSFVTGLKRLAKDKDYMVDLLGQLETSYRTRKGLLEGGTVGVIGYGGGVIPRFTELKDESGKPMFPDAAEFHAAHPAARRVCTTTDVLRKMCDVWENTARD